MKIKKGGLTEEKLSEIYDRLYDLADRILKKYDPCRFSKGDCIRHDSCCGAYPHLSGQGCTVKALACKVWLCPLAEKRYPACTRNLLRLEKIATYYDFIEIDNDIGYRESKQEIFKRLSASRSWREKHKNKGIMNRGTEYWQETLNKIIEQFN